MLEPDFHPRDLGGGKVRVADVKVDRIDSVEWVHRRGNFAFDEPSVSRRPGWLSFELPEGMRIPESLVIRNTGYDKPFKATHFRSRREREKSIASRKARRCSSSNTRPRSSTQD